MKKIILLFLGITLLLTACGSSGNSLEKYQDEIDEIAKKNDELASEISQREDNLESQLMEIDKIFDDGSKNLDQDEALKVAKEYVEYFSMSYSDLLSQLEFEGFGEGVALYAVNNCGADWNVEAEEAADTFKDYAETKEELIELLLVNGFTESEALHGAESAGF